MSGSFAQNKNGSTGSNHTEAIQEHGKIEYLLKCLCEEKDNNTNGSKNSK